MPEHADALLVVFVYGTLREGELNDIGLLAAQFGLPAPVPMGPASMAGRLVDFGDWPGLVPAADVSVYAGAAPGPAMKTPVCGELFRIDARLVPVLDHIEGIRADGRDCFYRQAQTLYIGDTTEPCFFYPIDEIASVGCPAIYPGDWVAWRQAKAARGVAY